MTRETIMTNSDDAGKADGEAHVPRYALAYMPGEARATLKASAADLGVLLTPKLAGELIEDLTIFIDQAKRKPRARKPPTAPGAKTDAHPRDGARD